MKSDSPPEPDGSGTEIIALIETLHRTGKRLEQLTGGEVDSVANREGQTFLLQHAQDQLRLNESARQVGILNALPASIALLDSDGVILAVNNAWQQFSGDEFKLPEQDIGINYLSVCDKARGRDAAEASQAAAGIRAVLKGKISSFSLEYPCHSPTRKRWFLMVAAPLAGYTSKSVVVMHLDITATRLAEIAMRASERRFSDFLGNVDLVSMMLDRDGRIDYCNDHLLQLAGWRMREVIGKRWWDVFVPPDQSEREKSLFRNLLENRPEALHHENEIRTRSGERRLIRWSNTIMRSGDGEAIGTASIGEDITKRRLAEANLAASESLLKEFIKHTPAAIAMLDTKMRYIQTSERWIQDYKLADKDIIGKSHYTIFPEISKRWKAIHQRVLEGAIERSDEDSLLLADGSIEWLQWEARPWYRSKNDIGGVIFFTQVITGRKEAEASIKYLNRVHSVLSSINTLIVRVKDREALLIGACKTAVEAGGFRMAMLAIVDPKTMMPLSIVSAGKDDDLLGAIKSVMSSTEGMKTSLIGQAINSKSTIIVNDSQNDSRLLFGKVYAEAGVNSIILLPLVVSNEGVGAIALYASEIDFFQEAEIKLLVELADNIAYAIDHIEKQERLNYLAYHDVLTGLANRTKFLERTEQHLRYARKRGHQLALGMIDIERFKNVNDSLGRPAGDALLRKAAAWLAKAVHDADLLARIDADHFAFVVPEVKSHGSLITLFDGIAKAFQAHRFMVEDTELRLAAKTGIAIFPGDGTDADTLFRNAEAALKRAKKSGDRHLFYTQKMTEAVAAKLDLENRLRKAIDGDEFVLHYQPKVNLLSGKVTSAEALIRWNDPIAGLVSPGVFIPILEETGLIREVGRWALHKAISDYLHWRAEGLPAVRIAVNVSPLQLREVNFIDEIKRVVALNPEAAAGLELEITESLIMEDVQHSIKSLASIRALGITVAIDDFGTGFSSLGYLAKLPVDTLKIDRSFVIKMDEPEGLALVSTIIILAHALELTVVAEGVETEQQMRQLLSLNCDEMQGFLFSKAVPVEIFESKFLTAPSPKIAG